MGCEHTFLEDLSGRSAVIIELYHTVLELVERVAKDQFEGHTLTLKVKYNDFTQITRSITVGRILQSKDDILPLAKQLLRQVDYSPRHPIRLLGLSVSNPRGGGDDTTGRPEWIELELEFLEDD